MEVILLESLDKLGKVGDVVIVKNGFARNFLFPQKKALRANKENKEYFLKIKNDLVEKNNKIIDEAKILVKKKISTEEIIFIRNASDNGQLYGSVSPRDISNFFKEKKIEIKPSCINLHSAIKKLVFLKLILNFTRMLCKLKLNVATSMENAKIQKESEQIKTKTDKSKQSISMVNEESKRSSKQHIGRIRRT